MKDKFCFSAESKSIKRVTVVFTVFYTLLFMASFSFAQTGFPFCGDFSDDSNPLFITGGSARVDDGVLRLTDADQDQSGYAYIDIPFPSNFGIKATFEMYIYGGTGGDGLSVFLFDAATQNFAPGGFGGSLGYAPRNEVPGLTGAYFGLGFDVFGNFSNSSENKNGGLSTDLTFPNTIAVRTGGSGFSGYNFLVAKTTLAVEETPISLPLNEMFALNSGIQGTPRVTNPDQVGYRKVYLELLPNPNGNGYLLNLEMDINNGEGLRRVVIFSNQPYTQSAPENLKIGFAASTGSIVNIHEIGELTVEVADQEGLENPVTREFEDLATCAGQDNFFEIPADAIDLPNENSTVRCLQFYSSLEEIEAVLDDICLQGRCRSDVLELEQGVLRANGNGVGYTFTPSADFIDQTLTVYYTIIDTYGRQSNGSALNLFIQESPNPVNIKFEDFDTETNEVSICEGELVRMEAFGDDLYSSFKWYLDDVFVRETQEPFYESGLPGAYKVEGYTNRNECFVVSEEILISIPELPEVTIQEEIIACLPEEAPNLLDYLEDFDPDSFDYRLIGPNGETRIEEAIDSVDLPPGEFTIEAKRKGLECFGPPSNFVVNYVTEPLMLSISYQLTDPSRPSDADIFIDDELSFSFESNRTIVESEWDFGDGSTASGLTPSHVFGERGEYLIQVTAIDEFGCLTTDEITLVLDLSYRVMIPTGFTPAQFENRYFRPKVRGIVEMELLVFNLWGNMVFQSNDLDTVGWDGSFKGELAPGGSYVYKVKMLSVDGEVFEETGKFQLIR